MSLRINQNVLSIQTHGTLTQTSTRLEKSIAKLSSGLRIAHAADDAAGLAISEKMRRQIRAFSRAILNAQDGISMLQTGEGALDETHSNLQRMRELAIQASNDTLTSNDRLEIQKEINQLRDDIDRIARNTEFNTKKLLDGSQTALVSANTAYAKGIVTGTGNDFGDFEISMTLLKGGSAQMQRTQIFTIAGTSGELAKGSTQLQSIAQFYDGNGVFALTNAQVLTINGNSKSATVNVDGKMTLDKMAGAIANAIQGASGLVINNAKVQVINTASTGIAGMGGYMQVTSGMVGMEGQISFATDQNLLNALGFTTTRAAEDNLVQLKSVDTAGNIRTVETSDGRAVGLLNGVDVKFTSQSAQIGGSKGLEQGIIISTAFSILISSVGGVVSEGTYTIESGNWTMDGLARSINLQIQTSAVATLHNGLTASVIDGQLRLGYEPTIVTNSNTFNVLSTAGGTMLNTIIGITDGSKSGFTTGSKDASKIAWGFTTYQTTASTVTYSVSDGVNAADIVMYSAVATQTTADMLTFNELQATVNDQLYQNGSVSVRLDQTGSTIAFTSTRVGTEIQTNGTKYSSFVSVNIIATGGMSASATAKFEIDPTSATGVGEKNYRIHVVGNQPQFHIGDAEGQTMKVNMANMSSEALGVANLDMTSLAGASKAMGIISRAIDKVSSERSKLGAFQNRLEHSINNLRTMHSNVTASESRIRDADVALEMIEFTRNQIMQQSGTAMLAQANMVPQGVLQLLK